MVWHAEDSIADSLKTEQRRGPAVWVVLRWLLTKEGREINGALLRVHGRDPVGGNKGYVPVSVAHAVVFEERLFERMQIECFEVEGEAGMSLGFEVPPLGSNSVLKGRILSNRDAKGLIAGIAAHLRNSSVMSWLCSPMRGAGRELVRSSPSIRIGQRVVRMVVPDWLSASRTTVWIISRERKASWAKRLSQVKTSAHQISAGSRMDSQCCVVWCLR